MALLFISNVVPDRKPYNEKGFTRSGNNVLLGIAYALPQEEAPVLVSCRPCMSFPRSPLWISGEKVMLDNGREIQILPTLNVKVIKNLFWGILITKLINKWSKRNHNEPRYVLTYNIYTPPVSWVYKACKKAGCKLVSILYDLGVPPARLGLSKITMMGYKAMEREAKKYIPQLDGRVVINESIVRHYAPGKNYLLLDGGINDTIMSNLFPLTEDDSSTFTFVLAGMLWDQNGTKLVLKCLESHPELKIKVVFAGQGIDVPLIKESASRDERVEYVGMLTVNELFKLYSKADVLLNLRLEEEVDFHFPSKLLEYLTTGKHVLSTPIAHAERDYGKYMTVLHEMTPDGLANCMSAIMERGKHSLYQQGVEARNYMLENRNWYVQTRRILEYMNANI